MIAITDKKRLLISTVFILAIFLTSCSKKTSSSTSTENDSIASKVGGLASALISGDSFKCKYVSNSDQSAGEYLVKNKMFRVDGQNGPNNTKSSIIMNSKGMYMWTPGEKQGLFYPVTEESKQGDSTKTNNSQFDDYLNPEKLDDKEKIDCQKSLIDDSVFSPPSDVEFQDFSQMMNSFTNPGSSGTNMPNIDTNNLPSAEDLQ